MKTAAVAEANANSIEILSVLVYFRIQCYRHRDSSMESSEFLIIIGV